MQTSEEEGCQTRIDDLPSEIWTHIFDFLEWDEVCRASTSISLKLSQSLLVDDPQELFYRHLCLRSMKKDMKQTIDNILNRSIVFMSYTRRYYYGHGNPKERKIKSNASPSHASMAQLRNRLEHESNLLFNYFPELYNEYSESITQALNYSHSSYDETREDELLDDNNQIVKQPQMKTGYSFQFKKSNKIPKWKSIWNGYLRESPKHKVMDVINSLKVKSAPNFEIQNYTVLKTNLKKLPQTLRHSIMFKTNYSKSKIRVFKNCSSDMIGFLIYSLKIRRFIEMGPFFDLLEYVIEESKTFYGNYNSLTKDIIPNASPFHYLLKYCNKCADQVNTFIAKYAFVLRHQSQTYRLSLLTHCLKHAADLKIINQLIYLGIVDIDTIKQKKKTVSKKTMCSIAYFIAVNAYRNCYGTESMNYLVRFTNLIIRLCNSDQFDKNYVPEAEYKVNNSCLKVHASGGVFEPPMLKLRNFRNVSLFKNLVQEVYSEIPFPPTDSYSYFRGNENLKTFMTQFYKYCKPADLVAGDEDVPLDELVGFERHKFGRLSDMRRRK